MVAECLSKKLNIALSNKIVGTDNGSAAFPYIFGARQLVQNIARLIEQIAADYIWGAAINQIPVVNAIMAPQIKIEQLFSTRLQRFFCYELANP